MPHAPTGSAPSSKVHGIAGQNHGVSIEGYEKDAVRGDLHRARILLWGPVVVEVMKTIMVRYKTSVATGDANEASVRAVFDELRMRAPGGIRYASYRLADGVTFIHVASVESSEKNPLTSLPSFKAFQAQLKDRCVEPPVVTDVSIVGAYIGSDSEVASCVHATGSEPRRRPGS